MMRKLSHKREMLKEKDKPKNPRRKRNAKIEERKRRR